MKKFVDKVIICPKCGTEGKVRWIRSFNAAVDRTLMGHLIDEPYEIYTCEKCKNERRYDFQIVYYGATQEVNVAYVAKDEQDELWTLQK